MNIELEVALSRFRQASTEARKLLKKVTGEMLASLDDEIVRDETPLEVQTSMEIALKDVRKAIQLLEAAVRVGTTSTTIDHSHPTRQQGQFLAFIREFMMRNENGVAPSHADFQRFFNLTPPSVNSMLIRLEARGFIRRVPHTARAIELIVDPDWIPPLERRFKF